MHTEADENEMAIQKLFQVCGHRWAPLGTTEHICANFATCSWEPLTMLNPHFVAGKHGLFGAHKSEDIRTILFHFFKVKK